MDICHFIIECSQIEKSVEKSRQFLTEIPSYHPYTAFKTISILGTTFSSQQVQIFLHKHGLLHTLKECSIIFYKNEFNYTDFLRFILPSDQQLRNFISSQEPKAELSKEAAFILAKHFDLEINLMYTLKVPKDVEKLGRGTKEGIRDYFQKQLAFIYQEEVEAALRRLDFYGDGEIDLVLLNKWGEILNINIQGTQSAYSTPKKQIQRKQVCQTSTNLKVQSTQTTEKKQKNGINDNKNNNNNVNQTAFSTEKKYNKQKQKIRSEIAIKKESKLKGQTPVSRLIEKIKVKTKSKEPCEILEYLVDKQIRIEKLKQQLAMQKDFNAFDAFKGIDRYFRGFITELDFDEFMQQKHGTARKIFENYEGNILKFSDFIHLIQPSAQEYAEIMHNRLPRSEQINVSLIDIFCKHTLRLLFDLLKILQEQNVKLCGNRQLFNQIDNLTRDNYLGVSDIQQYLYENNIRYTHAEVMLLVQNYDKDKDGRLTYEEFIQM